MNARKTALSLLLRHEEGAYLNLLLPQGAPKSAEERRDRAFLTALLYGTVERKISLDYAIAVYTKKPAESLSPHTRAALRIGLYQIFFMEGVPSYAAIAETLALAAHTGEKALLSAVLHRAEREGRCPFPPREKKLDRYLSVAYSLPREIVRFFLSRFGEAETERILAAFLSEKGLTLRVNTLKTSRKALLDRLTAEGLSACPTENAPAGIRILGGASPRELPGFDAGEFFVQDEASQIAVAALGITPGQRILDLCAAPGGKSFGAAIDAKDGEVLSLDLHESKTSLIQDGAARLGLSRISVAAADATEEIPALFSQFDCVICDVPCSGLGVLGKKPDMRYADPDRFTALLPTQERILGNAAAYVKRGGILLYSTCTLRPEENDAQVETFLSRHPEFSLEPFTVGGISAEKGTLTLLPSVHGTDGFFIARMRKES